MPSVRGLIALVFSALGTGCFSARPSAPDAFESQGARNVVESPLRDNDELKVIKRTRREAEKAWSQFCASSRHKHGDPYHEGFVEGFVDYVLAGGAGEPPFLPPFRYRLKESRTPDGVARLEEWYAGWRQGAAVARASGLRELTLIPLPGAAIPKDPNSSDAPDAGTMPSSSGQSGSPWDAPGILPMPKPAPLPIVPTPAAPSPRAIPPVAPQPLPQAVVPQMSAPRPVSVMPQDIVPPAGGSSQPPLLQQSLPAPLVIVSRPVSVRPSPVSVAPAPATATSLQAVKPAEAVVQPAPNRIRMADPNEPWRSAPPVVDPGPK